MKKLFFFYQKFIFFTKKIIVTSQQTHPENVQDLLSSISGISGRISIYVLPFLCITFNIYSICVPYLLNTPQSRSNETFKRKPFLKMPQSSRYLPIDDGSRVERTFYEFKTLACACLLIHNPSASIPFICFHDDFDYLPF